MRANRIPVGRPLVDLLCMAHGANTPVLLHGRHGLGKSETFHEAARQLGIEALVLDLSILEPADLTGLPLIHDGFTSYAPPALLPTTGKGFLVLEELNRCQGYMRPAALNLLTARRLNRYVLPDGWLPCASCNDAEDGYDVEDLDAALTSRFIEVECMADVSEWLFWAKVHSVHPAVVHLVEHTPKVFDDPDANPRAWTYASKILHQADSQPVTDEILVTALSGVLKKPSLALALVRLYHRSTARPLAPAEIVASYSNHRGVVRSWKNLGRLDLVESTLDNLRRYLAPQPVFDEVVENAAQKRNVENFFGDLPADLKRGLKEWLAARRFFELVVPAKARSGA